MASPGVICRSTDCPLCSGALWFVESDDAEASRCEMLRAAARMGDAFSLFVGNVASTNGEQQ